MALSLESANLVRQKAYAALSGTNNSSAYHDLIWTTVRGFFNTWVNGGANANLQFIPFSEADADAAGGTVLADAACQVYLVYVNKLGAATENHVKLYDDATDDTTTTDQHIVIMLDQANQEALLVYPQGIAMATGVVVTQHTTSEGTTDGSDGGDGFIIIGAA